MLLEPARSAANTAIFQEDVVLPSQYFNRRLFGPEIALMIAVLRDAMECLEKFRKANDLHRQRQYIDATKWFLTARSDWPFSFERVCEALDLNPAAVRAQLDLDPGILAHRTSAPRSRRHALSRRRLRTAHPNLGQQADDRDCTDE